jgi:hypothetical protein
MSRGRRSDRARAAAVPVAAMRGEVLFLNRRPDTCFDFIISGPSGTSAVRVGRALRIHGSLLEIAAEYTDTLDRIRAAALTFGMAREFWLWSPWGTMRYFRINGPLISELDLLGNERLPLVKGSLKGTMRPRWRKRGKKSRGRVPESGPEECTDPGGDPSAPGSGEMTGRVSKTGPESETPPAPAGKIVHEPAPVRFLRRRVSAKKDAATPAGKAAAGPPGKAEEDSELHREKTTPVSIATRGKKEGVPLVRAVPFGPAEGAPAVKADPPEKGDGEDGDENGSRGEKGGMIPPSAPGASGGQTHRGLF